MLNPLFSTSLSFSNFLFKLLFASHVGFSYSLFALHIGFSFSHLGGLDCFGIFIFRG